RTRRPPSANLIRSPPRSLGQEIPQALPPGNQVEEGNELLGIAKAQARPWQESLLGTLHSEGDCRSRGNRVQPQLIAQLGGAENSVAVANPTQRSESEKTLVFQPDLAGWTRIDMLAADGAACARVPRHLPGGIQRLAGHCFGGLEGSLLEVPRRQGCESIEGEQVRDGAELAIFGRGRPK